MKGQTAWTEPATGDELLAALSALANPHRLRIIAALSTGRNYVSQLAREIQMSRPLLHMHLLKLEAAGLIAGTLELSQEDGKAMKYFELTDFTMAISPDAIARLAGTLSSDSAEKKEATE